MKIGIIGCGNMGSALLRGILAKRLAPNQAIFCFDKDRNKLKGVRAQFSITVCASISELVRKSEVIIVAVKPGDVALVLADFTGSLEGKLIVSVCAGIPTRMYERVLGKVAVARVMPNLPAQIGQGISALSMGRFTGARQKKTALLLLSAVGEVVEVKEHLINAVTAISGSGPAFFFYLAELMIATARQLGLDETTAKRLVLKTALGSALLLEQTTQRPQVLRQLVTSKEGTTEAAFKVLTKKKIQSIFTLAIKAAAKRAKGLEKTR
ncbi:MAG: pyrroline-5-carboxylate reductase [Candidatus Omnitrophota bacterium]